MPTSTDDRYAPSSWGGGGTDLTMPSGQLALVRKPNPVALLDKIHSIDTLTPMVEQLIRKADGRPETKIDVNDVITSPEQLTQLMHVIDRVTCETVIRPTVSMTPNDSTNRKPGVVYCDDIELEDRLFIFSYAISGVRDVEQFRSESSEALGELAAITKTPFTSQRDLSHR